MLPSGLDTPRADVSNGIILMKTERNRVNVIFEKPFFQYDFSREAA